VDHPLGHPRNPMPDAAVREKFRDNARLVFDDKRIDRILGMGEGLATLPDSAEFAAALSRAA
jgi:2-methylcitrate dehydratase PrpD